MPTTPAQPGLATPPPTAPPVITVGSPLTSSAAAPTPTTATVPAAFPPGPIPPPPTFGELDPVFLTDRALSSRGVHPTVLQALPEIVSAADTRPWFVVTVGCYTGVYQEWYVKSIAS